MCGLLEGRMSSSLCAPRMVSEQIDAKGAWAAVVGVLHGHAREPALESKDHRTQHLSTAPSQRSRARRVRAHVRAYVRVYASGTKCSPCCGNTMPCHARTRTQKQHCCVHRDGVEAVLQR